MWTKEKLIFAQVTVAEQHQKTKIKCQIEIETKCQTIKTIRLYVAGIFSLLWM